MGSSPLRDSTGTRLVAVAARDRARAEAFAARQRGRASPRFLRRRRDRPGRRGDLQPARERPARPVEPCRHRRRQARAVREAVCQQRRGGRGGSRCRKRAGVVVADGFHYLYHPVTRRLHALVATGELGDIHRVEVVMVTPRPSRTTPAGPLARRRGADGPGLLQPARPPGAGSVAGRRARRSWPCGAASAPVCRASTSGWTWTCSSPPGAGPRPLPHGRRRRRS